MGTIKLRKFRKVMFTDRQMLVAKESGKFSCPPDTPMDKQHRPFIEFLFKGQHKCVVLDHTKLKYDFITRNGVCAVVVEGAVGEAIGFI